MMSAFSLPINALMTKSSHFLRGLLLMAEVTERRTGESIILHDFYLYGK